MALSSIFWLSGYCQHCSFLCYMLSLGCTTSPQFQNQLGQMIEDWSLQNHGSQWTHHPDKLVGTATCCSNTTLTDTACFSKGVVSRISQICCRNMFQFLSRRKKSSSLIYMLCEGMGLSEVLKVQCHLTLGMVSWQGTCLQTMKSYNYSLCR